MQYPADNYQQKVMSLDLTKCFSTKKHIFCLNQPQQHTEIRFHNNPAQIVLLIYHIKLYKSVLKNTQEGNEPKESYFCDDTS